MKLLKKSSIILICLALFQCDVPFVPLIKAQAQEDAYIIDSIHIDKTAENASQARRGAIAYGEGVAVRQLFEQLKISQEEREALLKNVPSSRLRRMIKGFSLADERISGTRYSADMTVEFYPQIVEQLLTQQGVEIVAGRRTDAPELYIPVFYHNGNMVVSGSGNIWRTAWSDTHDMLQQYRTPPFTLIGDSDALSEEAISAVLGGRHDMLRDVFADNNVAEVTIMQAQYESGQLEFPSLVVQKIVISRDGQMRRDEPMEFTDRQFLPASAFTRQVVEQMAAENIRRSEHESWLAQQSGELEFILPVNDMQQYADTYRRLGGMDIITSLDVREVTPAYVRIFLTYKKTSQQLYEELRAARLDLVQTGNIVTMIALVADAEL